MSKPRVVVSGAGIAGTMLAYWLGKHGFSVTIIERSAASSEQGQVIDVEGPSREIVRRMGLLDEIQEQSTHEAGIRIMNDEGEAIAKFAAGDTNISNEIEIMRPALAGVLLAAAEQFESVEFRYGCTIHGIQQTSSKVLVDIHSKTNNETSKEDFDILVSSDGLRSSTRDMILPFPSRSNCLKSANVFVAFFTIPALPQDRPYANVYNIPGRRSAFLKPYTATETSAYLSVGKANPRLHAARESRDVGRQKEAIKEVFEGVRGWETERVVAGMMETRNFYFEEITQVMLDKWWHGRCVLLGDTAYCPSPLTGQGTNLAILGAYVLAAKIVGSAQDPERAFDEYDKDMRPYVNKVQPIPLGGYLPLLVNPDTAWGIWILRFLVRWISWLDIGRFLPGGKKTPFDLPEL